MTTRDRMRVQADLLRLIGINEITQEEASVFMWAETAGLQSAVGHFCKQGALPGNVVATITKVRSRLVALNGDGST